MKTRNTILRRILILLMVVAMLPFAVHVASAEKGAAAVGGFISSEMAESSNYTNETREVTATPQSNSSYTVEFTYGELQYVLPGDGEVALSEVLAAVGLVGEPTDVEVSDPALFSASCESGAWVISSHQAFSSTEWMRVTIAGQPYKIAVTDEQDGDNICGDNLTWKLSGGVLTISGSGPMYDYGMTGHAPWYNDKSSITSVVIGDGVTTVGNQAFEECAHCTSTTIPASVESIGEHAFNDCRELASIEGMGGVETIGLGAFYNCKTLTSIDIPDGMTTIGTAAFYNCTGITGIEIPSSVTSIGGDAFYNCSNLEHICCAPNQKAMIEGKFNNTPLASDNYWFVGVEASPADGGTVTGGGFHTKGSQVTVKATPSEGWYFITWLESDGHTELNPYTFTAEKDRGLTAMFRRFFVVEEIPSQTYSAQDIAPEPIVTDKYTGSQLEKGKDYSVNYRAMNGETWTDVSSFRNVGDYYVEVTGQGDYGNTTISKPFAIEPAKVTLTSATAEKEYDGTPLTDSTVTVTGDGFSEGEGATYNVTGSQTKVGGESGNNTFTYTLNEGTKASNYDIKTVCGTLTVKANATEIKITSADGEQEYSGSEFHKAEYVVTYGDKTVDVNADGSFTLSTGDKLTVTDTSKVKDVSDTADGNNEFTYVLENADQYNSVSTVFGTLTVKKAGAPTLTDANKPTANDLTENGSDQALVTVPETVPEGYTVEYSVDGQNWSADIPTGKDSGDYAVQVRYTGDSNHESFTGETVTVRIKAVYTLIWLDVEGSELDKKTYVEGENVPTTDKEPAKQEDDDNTYTFDKWDEGTVDGKTTTFRPIFTATKKENPATGDGDAIVIGIALMALSGAVLAIAFGKRRSAAR